MTNADIGSMDLSKVLGEMYADDVAPRPSAPEWADEATLDEAFANWTPGPPPEAPAAEHEMAAHESHRIDDDLNAALTQALGSDQIYPEAVFVDHQVEVEPEPVVAYELAPLPEPAHSWSRADDDVLPSGGGARRGRHFGRR